MVRGGCVFVREAGRVKLADGIALYHQQLHQQWKKQNKTPEMTSTSHMGAKVGYEIKQSTALLNYGDSYTTSWDVELEDRKKEAQVLPAAGV